MTLMTASAVPSAVFKAMLPEKPSHTATSMSPLHDVAPFDVADEVDALQPFQEVIALLVERVALVFLGAVGDEPDTRVRDARSLGVRRAHDRKVRQIDRLALGVRARVDDEHPAARRGGEHGADGGAGNAADAPDAQKRAP